MFPVCVTCGAQFAQGDAPPAQCPVCEDARQYVPTSGQRWTTLEALREDHGNWIRDDGGLTGIGTEPRFAIGQRALLVPHGDGRLMWDCITLLDDETAEQVGSLTGIAISHPHYYSSMVEWAHRFDCPVYLHEADRGWIMRPDDAIELWSGETKELGGGLTLVRCGGHFDGGTVLHWADGNALLAGDVVQVIPDRAWVSFMYSFPNYIPLDEGAIYRIVAALEPFDFERIYGAWWGTVIPAEGKEIVLRSAERYVRALRGERID